MSEKKTYQQLKMVWSEHLLNSPPEVYVPTGYTLRTNQPGDEPGFYKVMDLAGFKNVEPETHMIRPYEEKDLSVLLDVWYSALFVARSIF